MRGIPRTDINLEVLKNQYEAGNTTRELCQIYSCSLETLYRKLKEAGIKINKPNTLQRQKIMRKKWRHYLGEKSPHWKGGKTKNTQGYVLIRHPSHERRCPKGYVREHLLVWEKFYNKKLPKGYVIHHLNGIKDDNRPENLVAMKHGEHINQREPYKKRIRELEAEIAKLKQPQLFKINE